MKLQVKIEETVKEDLDSLKFYEKETYSDVIKRLIEENKELKKDKAKLYQLVLKTTDSVGLANNVHKATYFIANVIEDKATSEEEKLQVLEHYLKEMLVEDQHSILEAIDILKDVGTSEDSLIVLAKFEKYVKTSS
jgi:predicted CopG family antitoxin